MSDTEMLESWFAEDEPETARERRRRERPRRDGKGRALLVIGLVLILGGLGVLGWVGWQFWGTNWVSGQRHSEVQTSIQDGWDDGERAVRTDWGDATALVRIPRFGEDYEMPVLEGASDAALAAGIGHMEDTAPGRRGNYVLAAHRVTHGEPFADFPSLRPGDQVVVETRDAILTYELDTGGEDLIVPFTESWVLDERPENPDGGTQPPDGVGRKLITLVTCSEIFHTDNRSVAFGHLVDRVDKTGTGA
jgi:sortase A